MSEGQEIVWYLEPIGPKTRETNKALAGLLQKEDACTNVMCADKETHNLWRCGERTVRAFKNDSQFGVLIWKQAAGGDIVRGEPDSIDKHPSRPPPSNPRIREIVERLSRSKKGPASI